MGHECPVCLKNNLITNTFKLACKHAVCITCLDNLQKYMVNNKIAIKCPLCRKISTKNSWIRISETFYHNAPKKNLDSLIEEYSAELENVQDFNITLSTSFTNKSESTKETLQQEVVRLQQKIFLLDQAHKQQLEKVEKDNKNKTKKIKEDLKSLQYQNEQLHFELKAAHLQSKCWPKNHPIITTSSFNTEGTVRNCFLCEEGSEEDGIPFPSSDLDDIRHHIFEHLKEEEECPTCDNVNFSVMDSESKAMHYLRAHQCAPIVTCGSCSCEFLFTSQFLCHQCVNHTQSSSES